MASEQINTNHPANLDGNKIGEKRGLGLGSGIGLVMASMIGAGVFLSAGFMAQDLGPGEILLNWLAGAAIALAGAKAYAAVSQLVPRSGGEYRYLSELWHPALGYVAGWASLLMGFSAPVAVNALAAGSFAHTLFPGVNPTWVAAFLVVALTLLHALNLRLSQGAHNLLVVVNLTLVVGFVVMGLVGGSNQWPIWNPPNHHEGFPLQAFMINLFYVGFAFSGWNAAIYASEEFKEPRRDVGRSMLIGCALVAMLYLLVNWVFVANLTPDRASVVFEYDTAKVTLGHLVTKDILGDIGGKLMSILAIVAFVSAMSAMTFLGPRVYAAMAKDGFLPRWLRGQESRPPLGSALLQGAITLTLVLTYQLQQVLVAISAMLTLFSALTVASLFKVRLSRKHPEKPTMTSLLAAGFYFLVSAWMLYFGVKKSSDLLWLMEAVVALALVVYLLTAWRQQRKKPL